MKIKAFTLVEMIISIVILGILSAGTFVSIKHLYLRVAKSKAMSDLSSDSQVVVDQISALLYDRVPSSVIGSNDANGSNFSSVYGISGTYPILEWIGTASEALKARQYSGFVDLDGSNRTSRTLATDDFNETGINQILSDKFGSGYTVENSTAIIFAGAFDNGLLGDINNSFGWHNHNHNLTYTIQSTTINSIILDANASEIYEKFYLVDSAYAIARKENITSTCSDVNLSDKNNTLYLFYNYRPWNGDTFCNGNVTILSKDAKGFEVGIINDSIYFNLTLQRHIKGSDNNITISKQKVVF
jgi:prepilin-type N-terminal cleavage/methylation domain-containing protein